MKSYPGKRLFDLVITIPSLIVLSPFMLVLAVFVRQRMGTPVIFQQMRPGYHGMPFMLYKFRTMTTATDEKGKLLPDDVRLTAFGKFLRKTSLDELPELLNILRGEMSLVGPRPLMMQYLRRYSPEQGRRHDVKPGLTGWAQINGRNALSWEQKFELDLWYVDHQSLWLDIKIIALTFWQLIKRDGISAEGHATMPEFMGTLERKDDHASTP